MADIIILESEDKEKAKKISSFSIESINEWLMSQQGISVHDRVILFRLLATMVNAGLSIVKAITILEKQEKNPMLENVYRKILSYIKEGKNLSNALREFDSSFSDSECSIVESGEKTGKLNKSLLQLADQMERVEEISRKLKGALIYPIAIIFVMVGAVSVLMTMVVPKIIEIFGDPEKLPKSTKILIFVSKLFTEYGFYMLWGIIAATIGVMVWKKTEEGKYHFDEILLMLPIFGPLIRKVILSKFARVFSNLLWSGISIVESVRIVSDVVGNEVYKQRLLLLREDVRRGIKIGENLEDDPLFPDMLVQMIKIGEETATLDTIILKIADFYDQEAEITINNINKLLEPIIIVSMALVIGFIAIGIMEPIMNMAEMISKN